MEEEEGAWRRTGYSVQRQILDEETVDEIAEKADFTTTVSDKIKKSMRYLISFYHIMRITTFDDKKGFVFWV